MAGAKMSAHDAGEEESMAARVCKRQCREHVQQQWVMRFLMVRQQNSQTPEHAVARSGGEVAATTTMDDKVWSRNELPDDMLWEILLRVPAAKRFQCQMLSREWRERLTSAHTSHAVAAREHEGLTREPFKFAFLSCWLDPSKFQDPDPRSTGGKMLQVGTGSGSTSTRGSGSTSTRGSGSTSTRGSGSTSTRGSGSGSGRESPEVVNKDIDLSFVPTQFWDLPWPYHVMAAGDGLVCITDSLCFTCFKGIPLPSRFCVLNPLSRTCKTLPTLPIPTDLLDTHNFTMHLREDSITVFITGSTFRWLNNAGAWDWLVVTGDLTGPAATAEWRDARGRVVPDPNPGDGGNAEGQHTAWCNGKAFCYVDGQVLVHVVTQGPGVGLSLLEAARLAAPPNVRDAMASLVESRGRIFFMALVELQSSSGPSYRIWELSADLTAWLLVTSLGWQEFDSLTEARYTHCSVERMINACGARHQGLLCSEFVFKSSTAQVIVGYNLETSLWEIVYDGCWYQGRSNIVHAMELAPNSFLL